MFLQSYGEKWVDVDGVRTRYFKAGSGTETIVFIHGGQMGDGSGGENAEDWDLNFIPLSKHFTVIAVDRLGQGYTGNPLRDEDCTMAGAVRHVTGFLKALGGGPFHLLGHSRGGYVAARITLDTPALVTSCVIIDSNSAAPGTGRNDVIFCTNPHKPGTLESSRWVYENYSYTFDHITEDLLVMKQKITESPRNREAIRKMKDEGLYATRYLPELLDDKDVFFTQIETDGFRRPILLFWAYNDPTAPFDQGMRLFSLIAKRQARLMMHVVNQAGHFSFRERPDEFNRVVKDFIEGVGHGY